MPSVAATAACCGLRPVANAFAEVRRRREHETDDQPLSSAQGLPEEEKHRAQGRQEHDGLESVCHMNA
jgi:hypothetical protein